MTARRSTRRDDARPPHYCVECHRLLARALPGRCDACARRVSHGVALPDDARCLACGLSDRRVLAWELLGIERAVLCFNDAARLRCTGPAPATVREALERLAEIVNDRRQGDRRAGPADRREPHATAAVVPAVPAAITPPARPRARGRRAVDARAPAR